MALLINGRQATPVVSSGHPIAVRVASDATYTYVGEAAVGAAESDAVWRIQRVDSSGNVTWADGNANFDNVWVNYASLTYS